MATEKIDLNNLDKSDWKTYRFDEIAQNISERVDPNNTDLEVYIGLEHIDSESLHIKRHGTPDDVNGTKLKFYKDDIIFGRRRAYQRKAGIATCDGFCSAHALVLRANPDVIDPALFPFFMHSDLFMNRAVDISVGSLSPTINWGTLKHQEFILPPYNLHSDLATLFVASQNAFETRNETLNRLNTVYITKLESELLDKKSDKVFFSDLGDVIKGVGYKPDELIKDYSNDACIILRANNIKDSNINFDDIKILDIKHIKSSQILQDGDFAICMSNGSKDLVGKAAELESVLKNVAVGSFCAAFRPNNERNRMLLKHLFSSASYRMSVKRTLSGSTINNLKPSDIESMFFRINADKTKDIIYDLNNLMLNEKELSSEIYHLKQLQKSIVNQVF